MEVLANDFVDFLIDEGVFKVVDNTLCLTEEYSYMDTVIYEYINEPIYGNNKEFVIGHLIKGIVCHFKTDREHEDNVIELMNKFYKEVVNHSEIEKRTKTIDWDRTHSMLLQYYFTKKER